MALSSFAQTLELGFDAAGLLEPLTTDSYLFDGDVSLPSGFWHYHSAVSHDGVDSVRSSLPYRSDSRIKASIQGPATISFWWKIEGVTNYDRLFFYSKGDFTSISGTQDWTQRSFEVDTGEQPLQWYFERLASDVGEVEDDVAEAWLDQLVITPIPPNAALATALDNNTHDFHSTSWEVESDVDAEGGSLAQSGPVEAGEKSKMVFEIEGPAVVTFDWGMEADSSGESEFSVYVNGSNFGNLSGNQELGPGGFDLGPGTHAVKFEFTRGSEIFEEEGYAGEYRGRVDNLEIAAFGPSPTLADAVDRPGEVYSNSWVRQTAIHSDGSDAAVVTAPELNKYRRLYVALPDEAGLLTFWTKTETDAGKGRLFAVVDGDLALERSGAGEWAKTELNLGTGSNRILQFLFLRTADVDANSPSSRVFVDRIAFAPGVNNFQPDLAIAQRGKRFRGMGRHNRNGAGQTATIRTSARRPYGFYSIRCSQLSPSESDRVMLRGVGSLRHFDVFFVVTVDKKKLNYSAAFRTGKFSTLQLDPGESERHEIWVAKKKRGRARGHALTVVGRSEAVSAKVDVVKTRLILGR